MTLDELIDNLDDETIAPPAVAQSSVDTIIAMLATLEVKYQMTSREFRSRYKTLLREARSASERFDYGEWFMMFTALTKQAETVQEAIPKRRKCVIDENSERPAHAGLYTLCTG